MYSPPPSLPPPPLAAHAPTKPVSARRPRRLLSNRPWEIRFRRQRASDPRPATTSRLRRIKYWRPVHKRYVSAFRHQGGYDLYPDQTVCLCRFQDTVAVHPSQFGLPPTQAITNELNKKYANRVLHDVGLCVAVFDLSEVGEGKVRYGDGCLWYKGW